MRDSRPDPRESRISAGLSVQPVWSTGITGQPSGRGKWVVPAPVAGLALCGPAPRVAEPDDELVRQLREHTERLVPLLA